jgi:hypothetical protein
VRVSGLGGFPLGLEKPRVDDRHRRSIRRHVQKLDVIVGEHARGERADMKDPYHFAGDEQRHVAERLDTSLVHHGVEAGGVFHVCDHDGLPLGGYSADDALADRDTNAVDHLVDPVSDPSPDDELLRILVQEEENAGIGCEELTEPGQQDIQ